MCEAIIKVLFPLDDGFLRRSCPYCRREFKILLKKSEIEDLVSKLEDSFLVEETTGTETREDREVEGLFTCPYCGRQAGEDRWWTQEQQLHIRIHLENLAAEVINEQFIQPLKRKFGRKTSGPVSIRFEGKELEKKSAWMSPEASDMEIFELPCCERKVKIDPEWSGEIHCFFCGFPHASKGAGEGPDRRAAMPGGD